MIYLDFLNDIVIDLILICILLQLHNKLQLKSTDYILMFSEIISPEFLSVLPLSEIAKMLIGGAVGSARGGSERAFTYTVEGMCMDDPR